MSITIEPAFNGFIIIDNDFGEVGRKIVFENINDSFYESNLDELKNNKNLLYAIIELLFLKMQTADGYSIVLEIKDDQGNILPDE